MEISTSNLMRAMLAHHTALVHDAARRHNSDPTSAEKRRFLRDYKTLRFDLGWAAEQLVTVKEIVSPIHDLVVRTLPGHPLADFDNAMHFSDLTRGMNRKAYQRIWVLEASWCGHPNSHIPELLFETVIEHFQVGLTGLPQIILIG